MNVDELINEFYRQYSNKLSKTKKKQIENKKKNLIKNFKKIKLRKTHH